MNEWQFIHIYTDMCDDTEKELHCNAYNEIYPPNSLDVFICLTTI